MNFIDHAGKSDYYKGEQKNREVPRQVLIESIPEPTSNSYGNKKLQAEPAVF